jgi:hypothetical protein
MEDPMPDQAYRHAQLPGRQAKARQLLADRAFGGDSTTIRASSSTTWDRTQRGRWDRYGSPPSAVKSDIRQSAFDQI